jgi:uncharacterized protein (TIGR02246 family)
MSTHSTRTPRQLIDEQMAAFDDGDVDRLVALFADDGVLVDMHDPGTQIRGKDAYRAYLVEAFGPFRDISTETTAIIEDGNTIVIETTVRGTFLAEPEVEDGPRADVVLHYCLVERIEDGLVQEEHLYADSAELTRQI